MAFWNKTETRNADKQLTFGGVEITTSGPMFGGMSVNEKQIMQIPTVEACVSLIVNTISGLPIHLYKENANGSVKKLSKKDKRLFLLNNESDPNVSSNTFKKNLVKDYLLYGQAYAYKNYEVKKMVLGEALLELKELNYLPAENIQPKVFHDGTKHDYAEYTLTTITGQHVGENKKKTFKHNELLRIINNDTNNPFEGEGLLVRGKTVFQEALAQIEYSNGIYERGALPLGVLKTKSRLTEKAINALRFAWSKLYGGVKNSSNTIILEEGMEYQALSMNPSEIQMMESRRDVNSEICKLFGVPESMVSAKANKYGTLAQNNMHFKTYCVQPILNAIEQSLDRQLLTQKEKDNGYYFRFDVREMLRTTQDELSNSIDKLVNGGIITVNEGRFELDKPPVEGGDDLRLSLGNVLQDTENGDTHVLNMDGGTSSQEKGNDATYE
ncbi:MULTISPECIES: phage portal protein [Bacillus cereus group]|uniref:phage portal protein n=1 Tax=Bacillus cereus group TaxID=86661 RepID=UPI00077B05F3|nr:MULTISPECIES: phage portal protein [Bacillus cereus group]KXY76766.1 phage portal protein [Bacillus cereus]MBG9938498.1 HK97 family phage portal protein [Bacillus tropicus]MED2995290.1 phage portal protein [Bacillus tropicus]OTY52041.1 phage portal protein [Bacillus thuringiensis serovar graciosensis]